MAPLILIMEDDPFTQQFYNILFNKSNRPIKITEDGDEFFRILEHERVGLILLDVNLTKTTVQGKKVSGIDISKMLKTNDTFAHIPVIIITAYKDQLEGDDILKESLAEDYITKPIEDYNGFLKKIDANILL